MSPADLAALAVVLVTPAWIALLTVRLINQVRR